MTYLEAISGEIEPYSLSDESIEKAFIDACGRFAVFGDVEEEYDYSMKQPVALASMLCLNRLRVLESENVGGISQSFNVAKLEKRIRAIANEAGLSANLVLADDGESIVTYQRIW